MKKFFASLLIAFTALFYAPASAANLYALGDSIFNGYGTSGPGKNCPALIASYLGAAYLNGAVNGTAADNGAISVQTISPTAADYVAINFGANDSQVYFTAAQWEYYRGFMMAQTVKLSYPSRLVAASMVQNPPGSWLPRNPDPANRFPWSHGYYSLTPGATITGHVSGTTVYVGLSGTDWPGGLATAFPGTQQVEVWIDGVKQARTVTSDLPGMATAYVPSTSSAPYLVRFPGLSPGDHEVKLILQSGFVYFDDITGSDQPQGPDIYLFTPSRTYQTGDTHAPAPSLAFRQIIFDIANQVGVADGRKIHAVDTYSIVGPGNVIADGIHWPDVTHQACESLWLTVYQPTAPPPAPTKFPAYPFWDGTNYYLSSDPAWTLNIKGPL